jgi:hypothetical protein
MYVNGMNYFFVTGFCGELVEPYSIACCPAECHLDGCHSLQHTELISVVLSQKFLESQVATFC